MCVHVDPQTNPDNVSMDPSNKDLNTLLPSLRTLFGYNITEYNPDDEVTVGGAADASASPSEGNFATGREGGAYEEPVDANNWPSDVVTGGGASAAPVASTPTQNTSGSDGYVEPSYEELGYDPYEAPEDNPYEEPVDANNWPAYVVTVGGASAAPVAATPTQNTSGGDSYEEALDTSAHVLEATSAEMFSAAQKLAATKAIIDMIKAQGGLGLLLDDFVGMVRGYQPPSDEASDSKDIAGDADHHDAA